MTGENDRLPEAVRESLQPAGAGGLDAIRAAARAELAKAPHARPWWRDALPLVLVNVAVGAGATLAMSWNDVQHAGAVGRFGVAALLAVALLLGAVLAVRPGGRALRRLALLAVAATAVWAVLVGSGHSPGGTFWSGAGCAVTECLFSAVPMIAAALLLTRFSYDLGRALLGGAAAGAGGMLALHLHCPNGTLSHLLAFHVAPWLVLTAVLAAVRVFLPSRSAAP